MARNQYIVKKRVRSVVLSTSNVSFILENGTLSLNIYYSNENYKNIADFVFTFSYKIKHKRQSVSFSFSFLFLTSCIIKLFLKFDVWKLSIDF